MTVGTHQLVILLAIKPEAIFAFEFKRTDAYLRDTTIERLFAVLDAGSDTI